ncbi:MAG: hypothetical protein GVY08_11490 [Bacteroidetes bacterium]|jgi:FADH2 O2-dependent halogenase|nr:hypothetical protein [Bacteroidota bacterium]
MQHPKNSYDFLISGSGFAGSIAALCLNHAGYSVCLVEKGKHPRFAIGESSTPIADMILRKLAENYDLPGLRKLSRYGSWQANYPGVTCGLKRGFSYYKHFKNKRFTSDKHHVHELLVAASVDDENSDTQWYRPDTDALFVQMAKDAGIEYLDHTEIKSIKKRSANSWSIEATTRGHEMHLKSAFIIDATGSPDFSARFFGTTSSADGFRTSSRAIYSHFRDVAAWNSFLVENGFRTDDYPYNPDHSALHHLLEPGWMWMLRFNDALTSAGLVLDGADKNNHSAHEEWASIISDYPSLEKMFNNATLADPPNRLKKTGRLQRKLNTMHGDGWAALHHTAGFVDPLHSTGIAHSLAGVEKLVSILIATEHGEPARQKKLQQYEAAFFKELELIDLLVSGCYRSRQHFKLFTAYTILYFICSISYEQLRLGGTIPETFLNAEEPDLFHIVEEYHGRLHDLWNGTHAPSEIEISQFIEHVKKAINPFNSAGLMDPGKKNMYQHTAVEM